VNRQDRQAILKNNVSRDGEGKRESGVDKETAFLTGWQLPCDHHRILDEGHTVPGHAKTHRPPVDSAGVNEVYREGFRNTY
jgi:hypothetical protein